MVVEGVCLLAVLICRLGRHGTGLVGMLNDVPAAAEYEPGPPAVQCVSQAPPGFLEEDGLALSMVNVGELGMLIGELRGDRVGDDVECARQLRARAGDKAQHLPRVAGIVLGFDWPGRARP